MQSQWAPPNHPTHTPPFLNAPNCTFEKEVCIPGAARPKISL